MHESVFHNKINNMHLQNFHLLNFHFMLTLICCLITIFFFTDESVKAAYCLSLKTQSFGSACGLK